VSKLIIAALPSPRPEERLFLLIVDATGVDDAWCKITIWQNAICRHEGPVPPEAWPELFERHGNVVTWTDAGLDLLAEAHEAMLAVQRVLAQQSTQRLIDPTSGMLCPQTADDWRVIVAAYKLDIPIPNSP